MHHPFHRPAPPTPAPEFVTTRDIALSGVKKAAVVTGALALAAAAALLAAPAAFGQTSRYETAHVDYEIGHYERAFAAFATLADEGHCDAARLAQQMWRHGRPLYAIEFKVAPERLERWQRLPACPTAVASTGAGAEPRRP